MQYFWLNKKDENKKLILFFNGWAMNETPVQHLKNDDFDVLVLFDYRDVDFNLAQFDFSKYDEKYLVCWSMGVYVANLFKKDLIDFDKKIAINGTTSIIDDKGIEIKHFEDSLINESYFFKNANVARGGGRTRNALLCAVLAVPDVWGIVIRYLKGV